MDETVCLICSSQIFALRLGVEACRACACFFKRTVTSGRKFSCREGQRNCKIGRNLRFVCRSCRYDKCVKMGMNYENPPKKSARSQEKFRLKNENPGICSNVNSTEDTSLIDRMKAAYKSAYDRRLVQEKEYVEQHQLERLSHPTEEFYLATITSFYHLYRISVNESSAILQHVFCDYGNLPIEHMVILFKNFFVKFYIVEVVYLTSEYFNKSKIQTTSLITCGDLNCMDQWKIDESNIVRKDAYRTSVKGFVSEYTPLFGSMAKMDRLTEREFYALGVLCYCDVDTSSNLPEEIIVSAEKTRARVFNELQEYYRKELNLHDFSGRLCNLMTIAHSAGEAGILMNEEQRMYSTMFDICSDDRLLYEFFNH